MAEEIRPVAISNKENRADHEIHNAVSNGDSNRIEKLIQKDPTLANYLSGDGYSPLLLAIATAKPDVVELLLTHGADVNGSDTNRRSMAHWATVCGNREILTSLVKRNAHIATTDVFGAQPLHYATQVFATPQQKATSALVISTLLRHGARTDAQDVDSRTPLHWAASVCNMQAVQMLVQSGADVNARERDLLTPLHCATSHGHADVLEYLQRNSSSVIKINAKDRNGATPLIYAVTLGYVNCARLLLQAGASVNQQDRRGRTAAHYAAAKGQLQALKLLNQFGASFELQSSKGDLPLHEACLSNSTDIVSFLLDNQPAQVNAANHTGRTALHIAAAGDYVDLAGVLVTRGADVNALMKGKNHYLTPLDLAGQRNSRECVEFLRRSGGKHGFEMPQEELEKARMAVESGKTAFVKHRAIDSAVQTDNEDGTDKAKQRKNKKRRRKRSSDSTRGRRHSGELVLSRLGQSSTDEIETSRSRSQNNASRQSARGEYHRATSKRVASRQQANSLDTAMDNRESELSTDTGPELVAAHRGPYEQDFLLTNDQSKQHRPSRMQTRSHIPVYSQSARYGLSQPGSGQQQQLALWQNNGAVTTRSDAAFSDGDLIYGASGKGKRRSRRRYEEEKRVFEELAKLKRMQAQYGNVQEENLVKRMIDDFLQGDPVVHSGDFQIQTFDAWERFLHDQLKYMYLTDHGLVHRSRRGHQALESQRSVPVESHSLNIPQNRQRGASETRAEQIRRIYGTPHIPLQYSDKLHRAQAV